MRPTSARKTDTKEATAPALFTKHASDKPWAHIPHNVMAFDGSHVLVRDHVLKKYRTVRLNIEPDDECRRGFVTASISPILATGRLVSDPAAPQYYEFIRVVGGRTEAKKKGDLTIDVTTLNPSKTLSVLVPNGKPVKVGKATPTSCTRHDAESISVRLGDKHYVLSRSGESLVITTGDESAARLRIQHYVYGEKVVLK